MRYVSTRSSSLANVSELRRHARGEREGRGEAGAEPVDNGPDAVVNDVGDLADLFPDTVAGGVGDLRRLLQQLGLQGLSAPANANESLQRCGENDLNGAVLVLGGRGAGHGLEDCR